jgi:hypothetical protein
MVEYRETAFHNIAQRGQYFYPAYLAYGHGPSAVICDRCFNNGLQAAIHYEHHDLCLTCASEVMADLSQGRSVQIEENQNHYAEPVPLTYHFYHSIKVDFGFEQPVDDGIREEVEASADSDEDEDSDEEDNDYVHHRASAMEEID